MLLKGGPANSGMKQPKGEKPRAWTHLCAAHAEEGGVLLPGYWASCPDCGCKRP